MREIRHYCMARLFDSKYKVHLTGGVSPDLEIKCQRCSWKERRKITAGYIFALPHYIPPNNPKAIYCSDPNCLARLCDLSLPYTIVGHDGDIAIACHRCKMITRLRLSGIAEVHSIWEREAGIFCTIPTTPSHNPPPNFQSAIHIPRSTWASSIIEEYYLYRDLDNDV